MLILYEVVVVVVVFLITSSVHRRTCPISFVLNDRFYIQLDWNFNKP